MATPSSILFYFTFHVTLFSKKRICDRIFCFQKIVSLLDDFSKKLIGGGFLYGDKYGYKPHMK